MIPGSTNPARAVALGVGDRLAAGLAFTPRLSRTTGQTAVACAIAPMVAVTVALALTSDHLVRPVAAALYWSYLVAAPRAIGLYWWMRRPASRFGPLLIGFGALTWIAAWQGADTPAIFNLGVLAEGPFWLMTMYLFLAFPWAGWSRGRHAGSSVRWPSECWPSSIPGPCHRP
jgi:hypothetical protein